MPIERFTLWMGILIEFLFLQQTRGQISCYQCNIDNLLGRFTTECTDPYVPSPIDHLLPCPRNESHHCLKAAISYNNRYLTVRACVPSRRLDTYCAADNFASTFPGAEINCYYCEGDACNLSTPRVEPFCKLTFGLVVLAVVHSRDVIIG